MATAAAQKKGPGKQNQTINEKNEVAQNGRQSSGKGKGKGGKLAIMLKDCPEQKRLNDIQESQKQNRAKITSFSELITAKSKQIDDVFQQVTAINAKIKEEKIHIDALKNEKDQILARIEKLTNQREASLKVINDLRKTFPTSGKGSNEEFSQTSSKNLENLIKEKEKSISAGGVSPTEERQLVREINNLKKQRVDLSKFESKLAEFAKDKPLLDQLHGQKKEITAKMQTFIQARNELQDKRTLINTKIDGLKEEKKKLFEEKQKWMKKNDELSQDYKSTHSALDIKYNEVRKQQAEIARQKKEEYLERKKAEAEEAARRKAAYEAELALKLPFEDEIDLCDLLINYLVPLCPKENENVKKKKKVTAVLTHQMSVFQHFEELSMTPPLTVLDVNDTLIQLRAKKDRFLELRKAKIAEKEAAKAEEKTASIANDAETSEKAEEVKEKATSENDNSVEAEPATDNTTDQLASENPDSEN